MIKEQWIGIVRHNFVSIAVPTPLISDDIIYWIKRYENGKYHTAVSTGNRYELRSFEFYDEKITPCVISYNYDAGNLSPKHKWKCLKIVEIGLDATGSRCKITIADKNDRKFEIYMCGLSSKHSYGGFRMAIRENFYFTSIILFLRLLNKYADWEALEKNDANLFNSVIDSVGVPLKIFHEAEMINLGGKTS